MESIHGHEVLKMMMESNQTFTMVSLEQFLHQKFGKEAHYHTCSLNNMTAKELINFLNSRGKFVNMPNGFQVDRSKICDH